MALLWVILKRYTILEDFFLLDSVRYRDDVMTTLKIDWSNLKILMSGWYRKLSSSCVSFTIHQQCHTDIVGDATPVPLPISLQYQNVHRVASSFIRFHTSLHRVDWRLPMFSFHTLTSVSVCIGVFRTKSYIFDGPFCKDNQRLLAVNYLVNDF